MIAEEGENHIDRLRQPALSFARIQFRDPGLHAHALEAMQLERSELMARLDQLSEEG